MLSREFYSRETKKVAKELLGKIFVFRTAEGICKGKIVETEAYLSKKDPGARGGRLFEKPPKELIGSPGHCFVYLTYGFHYMFNFVTEPEGKAGAVLIRAVEPIQGQELMRKRRGRDDLTNGPGKFTQAFGISKKENGMDITKGSMFVEDAKGKFDMVTTTRIGLNYGEDLKLRFYIKGNEWVSRK